MEKIQKISESYTKRYMELYNQAQALFTEYNPCESGPDGSCLRTREDPGYERKLGDRCCGECEHHSPKTGCKTVSLSCKVWVCGLLASRMWGTGYPRLAEFSKKLNVIQRGVSRLSPYPTTRCSLARTLQLMEENYKRRTLGGQDGTEESLHLEGAFVDV